MRILALLLVCLPASASASRWPEPEEAVRTFWSAFADADVERFAAAVGFPFDWNGGCTIHLSLQPLVTQLRRRPDGLTVGGIRPLGTSDKAPLQDAAASMDSAGRRCASQAPGAPLFEQIGGRYFVADLVVGGRMIPTVTRVTKTDGVWRVTGFDLGEPRR